MTTEEFFNAHRGEKVLYKGMDINAHIAGYVGEKYIILGFDDDTGCIASFSQHVTGIDRIWKSYRFAKMKYLVTKK